MDFKYAVAVGRECRIQLHRGAGCAGVEKDENLSVWSISPVILVVLGRGRADISVFRSERSRDYDLSGSLCADVGGPATGVMVFRYYM